MSRIPSGPAGNRAAALQIVRRLRECGHQALFAGGCVRDQLMGAEPKDFDVATDARPQQVTALFARTREVGRQFGVVLVGVGEHWIETATFRADSAYSDGRHPDSIQYADMAADARRRDFTINGMFFDPIDGRVIDLVGGQDDLQRKSLRAIGNPDERFAEDHLRLLRAVRFAARLNFTIEAATAKAMTAAAPLLRRISPERICDELQRMLTAPSRTAAWRMLGEAGLMPHLWKGSEELLARGDQIAALLGGLAGECTFELALAMLLLPSPDAVRAACRGLRTSNEVQEAAAWLAAHSADLDQATPPDELSLAEFKKLMVHRSFGDLLTLLRCRLAASGAGDAAWRRAVDRAASIPADEVAPPPFVTGHDLLAWGVQPGPLYAGVLGQVYDAQLNNQLADRDAGLALARTLAAASTGESGSAGPLTG